MPQSQHPYVYCHNNPVNYTDPSGEAIPLLALAAIATLGGVALGAIGSGIMYALDHPCENIWKSPDFWAAVGIGAAAGGVGALVGVLVMAGLGPVLGTGLGAVGGD